MSKSEKSHYWVLICLSFFLFLQVITLFREVLRRLSAINKKAVPPFTHKTIHLTKVERWYDLVKSKLFFGKDGN